MSGFHVRLCEYTNVSLMLFQSQHGVKTQNYYIYSVNRSKMLSYYLYTVKVLKNFEHLCSQMLVIRARNHKLLVPNANREDPGQPAKAVDLGLCCMCRPILTGS